MPEALDRSASNPALELVDELNRPVPGSAKIGIIRALGTCPLGFDSNKMWNVDKDGHLSRPLCRPAVTSISNALRTLDEEELEAGVVCHCPIGDRNVGFTFENQI